MTRIRVLLIAEAVTLAHVVRLLSIGQGLDTNRFEVHLATDPRYRGVTGDPAFAVHSIRSMPPGEFHSAISSGAPIFSAARLAGYVTEDLALIESVSPAVVVSDFRISTGISARKSGVPLLNLTNAYWSPYARVRQILPEITLARTFGPHVGQILFNVFHRAGYAAHVAPVNALRRQYGMESLPRDFRHALVDGDATCYSDLSCIVPTEDLPSSHRFVGPIPWSPSGAKPPWWEAMLERAARQPLVYVTVGSSGPPTVLRTIVEALASLPVVVVAATAGQRHELPPRDNLFVAPFVPGDEVAELAQLVISNGGSPTTYQALAAGKPVLGVATNMDQFLNMGAVADAQLGVLLRSGALSEESVRSAASRILDDADVKQRATAMAREIRACDWRGAVQDVLESLIRG